MILEEVVCTLAYIALLLLVSMLGLISILFGLILIRDLAKDLREK